MRLFAQEDLSLAHLQLKAEADKSFHLKQLGDSLAVQAADAVAAAALSQEHASSAERRLQGVIDDMNLRWMLKWKTKMPLDLPEASSPLDMVPEVSCNAVPIITARALFVSELRRTFSYFSLFLNAFRDRATVAAKGSDICIKAQGKPGYACGMKLLHQCSKDHSKVMEAVVGSAARFTVCLAALTGDLQSQSHETDLLQSLIDNSNSICGALHRWSIFSRELSVCLSMLLLEGAAELSTGLGVVEGSVKLFLDDQVSGRGDRSGTRSAFSSLHRSIATLASISREVSVSLNACASLFFVRFLWLFV